MSCCLVFRLEAVFAAQILWEILLQIKKSSFLTFFQSIVFQFVRVVLACFSGVCAHIPHLIAPGSWRVTFLY